MHKIMLDTVRNYSNASEYYNQNRARCGDIEHTSNGDNIAAVARKMLDSGMTGDVEVWRGDVKCFTAQSIEKWASGKTGKGKQPKHLVRGN